VFKLVFLGTLINAALIFSAGNITDWILTNYGPSCKFAKMAQVKPDFNSFPDFASG